MSPAHMKEGAKLLSRRLDRRSFLGGAGIAAGAVVASTLVPLSVVHALPSQAVALTPMADDPSWNGHVDDACGHWPPYSYSIPYDVGRAPSALTARGAPGTPIVQVDFATEPFDHTLMV